MAEENFLDNLKPDTIKKGFVIANPFFIILTLGKNFLRIFLYTKKHKKRTRNNESLISLQSKK